MCPQQCRLCPCRCRGMTTIQDWPHKMFMMAWTTDFMQCACSPCAPHLWQAEQLRYFVAAAAGEHGCPALHATFSSLRPGARRLTAGAMQGVRLSIHCPYAHSFHAALVNSELISECPRTSVAKHCTTVSVRSAPPSPHVLGLGALLLGKVLPGADMAGSRSSSEADDQMCPSLCVTAVDFRLSSTVLTLNRWIPFAPLTPVAASPGCGAAVLAADSFSRLQHGVFLSTAAAPSAALCMALWLTEHCFQGRKVACIRSRSG
jgi:hypothetical protein